MARRRLKVALVSESFGYTSGVGVVLRFLVRFFQTQNAKIVLIGPKHPESEEWKEHQCLWLPSKLMKQRGYRRTWIRASGNNEPIIKALQDVDIVFCESISTLVLRVMILRWKGLIDCKVVFHAHTMADRYLWVWFGPLAWLLNLAIVKPVTWFCLTVSDARIAPSQFFANYLLRTQWCKKPIIAWPAPVEIPPNLPDPHQTVTGGIVSQFKKEHDFVFVANGRVCKEKRSCHLIKLILCLRKMGIDAGLVFVGGGEIEYFRHKIAAIDRKHFLFTGVLDREESIAINALCDLGIAMSVTDTQSLSILEQMVMKLPVVVPNDTVMDWCVRASDGGFILTKRTIAGMARKLAVFVQGRERFMELGQRAQTYVLANFSEKRQFGEMEKIVDQVLAS